MENIAMAALMRTATFVSRNRPNKPSNVRWLTPCKLRVDGWQRTLYPGHDNKQELMLCHIMVTSTSSGSCTLLTLAMGGTHCCHIP